MKTETIEQELEILKEEIVALRSEFYKLREIVLPTNEQIKTKELQKKLKNNAIKLCDDCGGKSILWTNPYNIRDGWGRTINECFKCHNNGYIEL